jgi:hypothetical protein
MRSFAKLGLRAAEGLRMTSVLTLLTLLLPGTAPAQVGYSPQSSPYRDIRRGHTFTLTGGYFFGDGGDFGMGPHDGPIVGVRYDIRTSRSIQFGLGVSYAQLQRIIVNPYVRLADRFSAPVDQSVTLADLGLQFNVTGGKTWRRLAPFLAATGGLAFGSGTPADTSGYDFGTKFYLAPGGGTRIFVNDRVHLRLEARATFWKLDYPSTFQQEPVEEPGTPGNPNAVIPGNNLDEWDTSWWLQAGLGFSFSP